MGYAENVAAGQARKSNELLEKQVAVGLETNRLLRLLLEAQGVRVQEPAQGSPAGEAKPKSGWQKFTDAF